MVHTVLLLYGHYRNHNGFSSEHLIRRLFGRPEQQSKAEPVPILQWACLSFCGLSNTRHDDPVATDKESVVYWTYNPPFSSSFRRSPSPIENKSYSTSSKGIRGCPLISGLVSTEVSPAVLRGHGCASRRQRKGKEYICLMLCSENCLECGN
jgi:hypothetical protein